MPERAKPHGVLSPAVVEGVKYVPDIHRSAPQIGIKQADGETWIDSKFQFEREDIINTCILV